MLTQNFGVTKMGCYGVFWSGQLSVSVKTSLKEFTGICFVNITSKRCWWSSLNVLSVLLSDVVSGIFVNFEFSPGKYSLIFALLVCAAPNGVCVCVIIFFFAPFWSEFVYANFCPVWIWRVWILEVWSENRCGKWHVLVWNRVRIWRSGRHTPTKYSQEYPLPGNLGGNWALIYVRFYNVVYQNDYYLETWWEPRNKILQKLYAITTFFSRCFSLSGYRAMRISL